MGSIRLHRMGQGHEPFLSIDEQALGARFPFSANQLGIFQMQETVGVASLSGEESSSDRDSSPCLSQ